MRLWLDDVRMPPDDDSDWYIVRDANPAMAMVMSGKVTHISFDHDLGENSLSGYAVACCIEAAAYHDRIPRMTWTIHSANPVGRDNITLAMKRADDYWEPRHCVHCGDWLTPKGACQGAGGPSGSPDGKARKFACYPDCGD
jgi:hypothetical protein